MYFKLQLSGLSTDLIDFYSYITMQIQPFLIEELKAQLYPTLSEGTSHHVPKKQRVLGLQSATKTPQF